MELSLDDLLSGLEQAQQKKSKVRLSERNVVELVAKLRQLGLLGDDLLYTTNGKEYVTRERAEAEVRAALRAAGGRVPLVDLPAQLGLDLVHCERAADAAVAAGRGAVTLAQGELFSTAYFDRLAAEVDEGLQEAGVVSVGDLARRFGLGAELIGGVLSGRVGGVIRGRLEAGVIYTQAYLTRIKAQLRGALRGAVAPLSVPALSRELGLEGLASLAALVPSLVEELAAEGSVSGKLAAGAASWVPASWVVSQQGAVKRFFQQNGYISYDTVKQYGIPAAKPFLAQHFPDGIALDTAYVSPAVVDQLEAAVEEALQAGAWCDVTPHVPSALSAADSAALLTRCRAVTTAAAAGGGAPLVLSGTCVVAAALLDGLRQRLLEEARTAADEAHRRGKAAGGGGVSVTVLKPGADGTRQKGAAGAASLEAAAAGSGSDDDWDAGGKRSKKGARGKKGKGGGGSGKPAKGGGKAAKPEPGSGGGGPEGGALSLAGLARRVVQLHPEVDGAGADGDLPLAIARELRPALVAEYERALHAIFTAGAERRRRLREAASAALDSAHERLLLYAHGCELLADDEVAHPAAQRHLLRTVAADCMDALLCYLAADAAGGEEEDDGGSDAAGNAGVGPLSASQRAVAVKQLAPDVRPAVAAAVEKLGGGSLEQFLSEFELAAQAAGLRLRRLDKRSERALVFAQRKAWAAQAAAAPDAAALLALAVPLLLARHHGRAVSLPGRALSAAVDVLEAGPAPPEAVQLLSDFHAAVVDQLRLASGGGEEAARGRVAARLEELTPRVRELAAAGGGSAGEAGGEA